MDAAIVPNFIVVGTDYRTLPDLLIGDVRDFADSRSTRDNDRTAHTPESANPPLPNECRH